MKIKITRSRRNSHTTSPESNRMFFLTKQISNSQKLNPIKTKFTESSNKIVQFKSNIFTELLMERTIYGHFKAPSCLSTIKAYYS